MFVSMAIVGFRGFKGLGHNFALHPGIERVCRQPAEGFDKELVRHAASKRCRSACRHKCVRVGAWWTGGVGCKLEGTWGDERA